MPRKHLLLTLAAVIILVFLGCSEETITPPPQAPQGDFAKNLTNLGQAAEGVAVGRYIVTLDPQAADVAGLAAVLAGKHSFAVDHIYTTALKGFAGNITAAVAEKLAAEPGVLRVEPDRLVAALAQDLPTGVDRIEVDHNPIAAIDGHPTLVDVDVAIIDTGLDALHVDLNVVGGVRLLGGTADPDFSDDFGHGTHLGGIIGARDNTVGVVGVAPGARLWGVKVLDGFGTGLVSDVVAGLDWVTARAETIEIATLSFGGIGWSYALHTAVQNCVGAGVVLVAAAGNQGRDILGPDGMLGTLDDIVPAAFPEVATISAMADADGAPFGVGGATSYGPDDSFAPFSNFARALAPGQPVISPGGGIDLLLPGVDILSTIPGNRLYSASGTSMAAAHGAGLAALHIAQFGRAHDAAEVAAVRQALIDRGVPQDSPVGLVVQNDPDPRKEPLGWAESGPVQGDLAITAFAGPASVVQGGVVELSGTVANVGPVAVSGPVTITVIETGGPRTLVNRTIGGMPAGASRSATISFPVGPDVEPGIYTLVCSHDFPDATPENNSRQITIEVFRGVPGGDTIGLYFDTAAVDTTRDGVNVGDHLTAYLLYSNPQVADARGFECGIDLVTLDKEAQVLSLLTASFPVGAIDVGLNDPAAGTYNLIVGYQDPIPTTQSHNVLATLDIFVLEAGRLNLFLRPAVPESPPITGRPAIILRDYTLRDVPAATALDNPALEINPSLIDPNSIVIDPDPDLINAPWHLQGSNGYSQSGQGDLILAQMSQASYTLTWLAVPQYVTPPAETAMLLNGQVLTFDAVYEPILEDERIGVFFDTAGADTLREGMIVGQHVEAYVLYMNPSVSTIRGFECGLDLVPVAKSAQLTSFLAISYPVAAVDVGVNDLAAGAYNLIPGFNSPVPASYRTVMATLDLFYLDEVGIDFYHRAADPESAPTVGLPAVLLDDFSILKVPLAHDPAQPALRVRPEPAPTGSITMNPNPNELNAPWTLIGPEETLTGNGDKFVPGLAVGSYTAVWGSVPGWIKPPDQTVQLVEDGVITVTGTYVPGTAGEVMGLFFDPAGTQTEIEADWLTQVSAYVVYKNSNLPAIRGFECGYDLAVPTKDAQFNTNITVSFPLQAVNIGTSNPAAGTYNYVVGYASPLVTSANTVVATLNILLLDQGSLDFMFRGSIPSTLPSGLPAVVREDYLVVEVPMAQPEGTPALRINPPVAGPGTVAIDPNPDSLNAPWTLAGPGGPFSGNGDQTLAGMTPGIYTVTWGTVPGWVAPASEAVELFPDGAVTFTGDYVQIPAGESLGMFFDTAGTQTEIDANFAAIVKAYVLYQNPSISATRGFESGFDIQIPVKDAQIITFVTTAFPVQAINVGTNNMTAGTYNYIVGFGSPLPTTAHTVMATLDIFLLEQGEVDILMRGAIPSSTPTGGTIVMREDFTWFEVPMAQTPGLPSLRINPVVQAAEDR